MLFYTTDAGAVWSDFPVRGLFLPMLYRSLVYLSAGGSVAGDDMEAGSSLQLLIQGLDAGTEILLENADGESFIPDQREVFAESPLRYLQVAPFRGAERRLDARDPPDLIVLDDRSRGQTYGFLRQVDRHRIPGP